MDNEKLEAIARAIFGESDQEWIDRWVGYWRESRERNLRLLNSFREIGLVDVHRKRVLDLGCGTGGMGDVIGEEAESYFGVDFHHHVLQFAERRPGRYYVQASGTALPFPDESFDLVICFDVIEHLVGGLAWQQSLLHELRRVLRPLGTVLLTTPNRWYPYEAHSELYFPQYLPLSLADRYIAWRNPGFLKEHHSFAEIRLMTPRQLRTSLGEAGLSFLHDLPCGLDRRQYRRLFPLRGLATWLGLGWYPHAEFWGILCHQEQKSRLRRKLPNSWYYERNQPSEGPIRDFAQEIDFEQAPFNHQLGTGWNWHERDQRGFRWTTRSAVFYLQSRAAVRYLCLSGFSPAHNRLSIEVDGCLVGQHHLDQQEHFKLEYLLPFSKTSDRLYEVRIECAQAIPPTSADDHRQLGVMIFSTGLAA